MFIFLERCINITEIFAKLESLSRQYKMVKYCWREIMDEKDQWLNPSRKRWSPNGLNCHWFLASISYTSLYTTFILSHDCSAIHYTTCMCCILFLFNVFALFMSYSLYVFQFNNEANFFYRSLLRLLANYGDIFLSNNTGFS